MSQTAMKMPASCYSSVVEEYEAATQRIGLLDRSHVGRLKVSGKDGLDLLNRLSTNDLLQLTSPGHGMYTVLTSNKGRVLDLLLVLRLDDHLLVLTGPENCKKVADWIDFYTFGEDVAVRDVTGELAMLALMGPGAAGLLDRLTGCDISSLPRYSSTPAQISNVEALVVRSDFVRLPGYDIVVQKAQAQELWQLLLGEGAGIRPVGTEALDVVRIEQGVPAYGRELSEEVNPLEAGLLEFVSFSKGCYVGQEVVARLNTYQKVQKHLVGLSWDYDASLAPGSSLLAEGKAAGEITSAARSPRLGKGIGLGYLRKASAQPGVQVTVGQPDGIAALVEELPLQGTPE